MYDNSALFLDRDAIVNVPNIIGGTPIAIWDVKQLRLVNGIKELIDYFDYLGYIILVVTNQPDIARGRVTQEKVDEINNEIMRLLPKIKKIYTCPHDNYQCECRKPKIGMIKDAVEEFKLDVNSSIIVGDRWSDLECGRNAHCQTIFVDYNWDREDNEVDCDYYVKFVSEIIKLFTEDK